jgi:hypothetical protein
VVWAQHPQHVLDYLAEGGYSPRWIPGPSPPVGEMLPGGQSARVVRTQHPFPVHE